MYKIDGNVTLGSEQVDKTDSVSTNLRRQFNIRGKIPFPPLYPHKLSVGFGDADDTAEAICTEKYHYYDASRRVFLVEFYIQHTFGVGKEMELDAWVEQVKEGFRKAGFDIS